MKYLVQAILNNNGVETVVDSLKTTDYEGSLDFLMKKHSASTHYIYIAMDIETQEIIVKTDKNKYYRW